MHAGRGKQLIRRLLIQKCQHAVAALALEVAERAGAGGDKVALLVVDLGLGGEGALACEIGRASCRERVSPYV